jgi:ABC-type multidrug transport system ATPase subunit
VGENGSGKSTLLRILAQIEKPDKGDVRYGGKSILGDRKFLRQKLGYVPQSNDLMEDLTVRAQLKLWQSACNINTPLPNDIMELLGIEPMMHKQIRTLSGGMQRRVSIAIALMTNPEILIMDEATTGLDKDYCQKLLTWLEGYLSRGGRILWCSHHKQELDRLCSGILSMDIFK